MEDTIGLAGSLGLINKGTAAFGGNVLTRASGKELDINIAEKKAEAARLAKQAQEEKLLASKLKVSGKFDEVARPAVSEAYTGMLTSGGTRDAQQVYGFNEFTKIQENASKAREMVSEDFTKNDYVDVSPEDRKALIQRNVKYLEERAKDPTSGIVKDPNLPDVYTLAPERRIPRMDANEMISKISATIPKEEASYDYSQSSRPTTVNGSTVMTYPVKESILNQRALNVLGYGIEGEPQGNPAIAANFISANRNKINAEIAANPNLTPYEATKKVFIDVLRENTMGGSKDNITSGKGGSSNWTFSGGGASNGEIALTKRSGERGEFDVSWTKGKGSELKSFSFSGESEKGTPTNIRFDSVSRIVKNKNGTASIYGDVSKSSKGVVKTSEIHNVPLSELESVLRINPEAWDKLEGKTNQDFDRHSEMIARQEKVDEWNKKYPESPKTIATLYPDDPKVTRFKVYQQEGWKPSSSATVAPVPPVAPAPVPPSTPVAAPVAAPITPTTPAASNKKIIAAPVVPSATVTPAAPKKKRTILQKIYGPEAKNTMGEAKPQEAYVTPSINNRYNINSYATDPNHERIVDSVYTKLKEPTAENIDEFIKRNAKNSPISGSMVKASADKYGVDPNALLAIIHADSTVGTKGKGARGKNAGNVGNTDDGSTRTFKTWEEGLDAVASWLKKHEKSAASTTKVASTKKKVPNKNNI